MIYCMLQFFLRRKCKNQIVSLSSEYCIHTFPAKKKLQHTINHPYNKVFSPVLTHSHLLLLYRSFFLRQNTHEFPDTKSCYSENKYFLSLILLACPEHLLVRYTNKRPVNQNTSLTNLQLCNS